MELTWSNIILPYMIPYLISILALLLLLEQITYLRKKRFLPGPALVLPFVGNAVSMATEPGRFWEIQSKYAKSTPLGISANYLFGRYVVYVSSTDLSHKIFANIRPDAFQFVAHPFGKKLFGERSMIYTFGQEHKDLRRRILPTFAPKALQTYSDIQQQITARHLACWCKESSEKNMSISLRALFRDMNMEISQKVFVGPYLDEEDRKQFKLDYAIIMVGLKTLPIDLPGFALRSAMLAKERIFRRLSLCVEASENRMKAGEEPTCLVDFCMQERLRETEVPGENQSYEFSHSEIGANLFGFFLAKQDASTSSLLWAVTYLESHPRVLEKVREEVARYWMPENDAGIFIKGEHLREMKYTEAVAREVLRIRPPAIVVPHIAGADFQLTENYTIPKGAIVFPSVFDSSFQGFTQPERFDPDRFMEERQEGKVYKRNFLAFGAGPHVCVGSMYALNHLTLFIAMFATSVDFKRDRTDDCDDIVYVPTMVPRDGCRVFLSIRAN